MPCDISFSLSLPSLFPTPGGAVSFGLSGCGPVSLAAPSGPSGPSIPGFGVPFSPANISIGLPAGMPENLLGISDYLQLLLPTGMLSANLSLNYEVDIFDGIMKLLDQFMPFLMLYKFFLPVLNIIVCIIEVLCSLINPFALIGALERLFTQCIPAFLNLFPIFALIIMIISILLLLLALIEYILCFIIKLVLSLSGNIVGLIEAFLVSNSVGILAIASKLGDMLCLFQDLLVLLAFFDVIIQVIKDILAGGFSIPPCSGGNSSNCCNPSVCPAFIQQSPYTLSSGQLQYSSEVGTETTLVINPSTTPPTYLTIDSSTETWQLYDPNQAIYQQFINIIAAPDVIADGYNIVFFPTTQTFSANTPPAQAAYTIDVTVDYDPAQWGRTGNAQEITFKNCIVLLAPTATLQGYNITTAEPTGVVYIAGGDGYAADGTPLNGYDLIYTTIQTNQPATLGNFLHIKPTFTSTPGAPSVINLTNVKYTFKPNNSILLQNNLISLGCMPTISLNRDFVNTVVFSDIATQTANLTSLVNGPNFPSPVAAQKCLLIAITNLRNNMTLEGVAEFQSTTTQCLTALQNNTNAALTSVIGIGFSPCNSAIALSPSTQFTTQPIIVNVTLNENNNLPIANRVPAAVGAELASQIIAYPTFGKISPFVYDGYSAFNANLTSDVPGTGSIMVAFQNQIICTNTMPANGNPSHVLQTLDYEFIYAPSNANIPATGEGDTTGIQPRREQGGGQ